MEIAPASHAGSDALERSTAAADALRAIVFREVLKPLSAALGPVGDTMLDRVVDGIFVRPKR